MSTQARARRRAPDVGRRSSHGGPAGAGHPRPAPTSLEALLSLQRAAGNAAVSALLSVQRCGDEVHEGCACAGPGPAHEEAVPVATAQRQAGPAVAAGPADAGATRTGDAACSTRCPGIPAECGPSFCCPYPTGTATVIKLHIEPIMLAGIAAKVTSKVVPVWAMWFAGGTSLQDFTGRFGADFATDDTTEDVASGLAADLPGKVDRAAIRALAAGPGAAAGVSLLPALPGGYRADTTAAMESPGPLKMNFMTIDSPTGNLAGDIGKDEASCPVGETPSTVDDARQLSDVVGRLTPNPDGSVDVAPSFRFHVVDTVDLCPGNCGASTEQVATIPMSRLEASGVAGDVPFFVDFASPPQPSFRVPPPPAPPPVPHDVALSASALFEFGSDRLQPGGRAALLSALGDRPAHADLSQPFTVDGHTDSRGSATFNQGLSERRARTIATLLEHDYPNLAGHLEVRGFGETQPLAPNTLPDGTDNPAGRRQNRRVEIHFSAPPAP
jgi:outer membrane protein OmpA-like peptidoglycan-associated protein